MLKKAENLAQLSDEDAKLVGQILIHCGAKLQNLLDSYDDPKVYAKVILKIMSSKQKLAAIRLLYNIKNKIAANELVSPGEFNRQLAKDMVDGANTIQSPTHIGEDFQDKGYIDAKRLSEILGILSDEKQLHLNMPVLSKIRGKKEIRSHLKKYPHENRTSDNARGSGGKPIRDTLSPQLERLIRVISIPEVISHCHNSMMESGLLLKAMNLLCLGELYAVRMQEDEEKTKDYYKATFEDNRIFTAEKAKNDINKLGVHTYKEYLLSLSEAQLEELVNKTTLMLIDNPINHNYLLSILFNPIYHPLD